MLQYLPFYCSWRRSISQGIISCRSGISSPCWSWKIVIVVPTEAIGLISLLLWGLILLLLTEVATATMGQGGHWGGAIDQSKRMHINIHDIITMAWDGQISYDGWRTLLHTEQHFEKVVHIQLQALSIWCTWYTWLHSSIQTETKRWFNSSYQMVHVGLTSLDPTDVATLTPGKRVDRCSQMPLNHSHHGELPRSDSMKVDKPLGFC